jgi:hypothetical protein
MADIFISWGSPDKKNVEQAVRRLKDIKLNIWQYLGEMKSGKILDQVREEIELAKLAIFFISDETVIRDWFKSELILCADKQRSTKHPMKHLIPVQIGTFAIENLPEFFSGNYVYDLNDPSIFEAEFNRLVKDISEKLGLPEPLIIPTTIFAMTKAECRELLEDQDQIENLRILYKDAGIKNDEEWPDHFLQRYHDTPKAFAPFSDEETIQHVIQGVLRQINRARIKSKPVSIHWYDRATLLDETAIGDKARAEWRRDRNLLIIDSISLLRGEIESNLKEILGFTTNERRRALVWIPPFTGHARNLHHLISKIKKPIQLRPLFDDWTKKPDRGMAFDTATDLSLRRWLTHTLRDLAESPPADDNKIAKMREQMPEPGITPEKMHIR